MRYSEPGSTTFRRVYRKGLVDSFGYSLHEYIPGGQRYRFFSYDHPHLSRPKKNEVHLYRFKWSKAIVDTARTPRIRRSPLCCSAYFPRTLCTGASSILHDGGPGRYDLRMPVTRFIVQVSVLMVGVHIGIELHCDHGSHWYEPVIRQNSGVTRRGDQ
jgi:hypothetical protein